ncbi:MAG: hypothetical protein LBH96_05045 [Candidatus Peribacteria bacterium]|jgi:hypothetical protein|nr:hypothetical protein [Candidatus Peribacteria bacterium]
MQPGNNKVHINPIHILHTLQAIADKKAKEQGIPNTFEFTINHLSEIVLHEINHIINHTELKLSKKTIEIEGEKLNMLDYQKYIYEKHGPAFHRFNNIFEDIDVNNHATKLQAPVFETSKQEIYQHICVPDANFSEIPLQEQFARTCLRESMIKESCIVDPIVRDYVNYITKP